jgi:hypothetical protein
MNADAGRRERRRRRGGGPRDGSGMGRGRAAGRSDGGKLTVARSLATLGTCIVQDLRDRDGLARPLLRRAAVRMVTSRQQTIRHVGTAYLRGDPPTPEELAVGTSPPEEQRQLPPAGPRSRLAAGVEACDVDEIGSDEDGSPPEGAAPV